MQPVYIIDAKRTAIGKFLGYFSNLSAPDLGSEVIKHLLKTHNLPDDAIAEVIMGQVLTGGSGQNPARQTAIQAGLSINIPALTINKVCGSGLKAVMLAANAIQAQQADLIIAGGQESMSNGLHGTMLRKGQKFGDSKLIDLMMYDGLTDVFSGKMMGVTAENIARQFDITRQMQDQLAVESQQKAAKAQAAGEFKAEIVPIEVKNGKNIELAEHDENIRPQTTLEALSKLKPAFAEGGTVTAGNSSTINDGAAAMLIASEAAVKKYNLTPMARIISYASAGVDPQIMGTGPVPASKAALARANWQVKDLDLIEANEAFASQAAYVNHQMQWDIKKVNTRGGAIALGHPIGASGARVLVTLLHNMLSQNAKKGLATLCVGGGMGVAMCIENLK